MLQIKWKLIHLPSLYTYITFLLRSILAICKMLLNPIWSFSLGFELVFIHWRTLWHPQAFWQWYLYITYHEFFDGCWSEEGRVVEGMKLPVAVVLILTSWAFTAKNKLNIIYAWIDSKVDLDSDFQICTILKLFKIIHILAGLTTEIFQVCAIFLCRILVLNK